MARQYMRAYNRVKKWFCFFNFEIFNFLSDLPQWEYIICQQQHGTRTNTDMKNQTNKQNTQKCVFTLLLLIMEMR